MSESNRVQISLIAETTWGTTPPTTPEFAICRHTGESLDYNVSTTKSNEIRSDRNTSDLIRTDYDATGGFNFEWSFTTFDLLLESALFGAWATNVLKNGTTEKSFSVERGHLDIDEYFLFTGMVVNSFSLDISAGSIVTGSFDFMGKDCVLAQTSGATTETAATTTDVMSAMTNVATILEGGSAIGAYVNKMSLNVNNNLRGQKAVANTGSVDMNSGSFDCGGTLEMFFTDDVVYDKFLAGTASSLSFQTTSGANTYTFDFPNVKFSSDKINAGGLNSDVMEVVGWEALYSGGTDLCSMKITRTA